MNNKSHIEKLPWFKGYDKTATIYIRRKTTTPDGKDCFNRVGAITIARKEDTKQIIVVGSLSAPGDQFSIKRSAEINARRLIGKNEEGFRLKLFKDSNWPLPASDYALENILVSLSIFPSLFRHRNKLGFNSYVEYLWGNDYQGYQQEFVETLNKIISRFFD